MVKLQAIPFTIHNQHWNTSWYIYWLSPTTNSSCSVKYSNYSCLAVPSWISTWRKLREVALPKAFPGLMKQEGECNIQANMIVSCDKCMKINPTKYELASFRSMVTPIPPPPTTHTLKTKPCCISGSEKTTRLYQQSIHEGQIYRYF